MSISLTTPSGASENARGIVAMLVAMVSFVLGDMLAKITGRDLPVGQLMFLRGVFATLLIVGPAFLAGAFVDARRALTAPMAVRTLCEIGATILFFSALVRMPFANVNAVGQFTPLAITAGAAIFFAEPVGWRRWLATAVGLCGVLIIIRPGTDAFDPAGLLVIGSVLCVAVRDLTTRQIGRKVPALLVTTVSTLSVTVGGLLMIPFEQWHAPTAEHFILMGLAAAFSCFGYYFIIQTMRIGEIAVVAPFRYSSTPFAVLTGYAAFGEVPDALTWLGILVVIGAGLYTLHRERVRRRLK
jgi:drug/metabolite transporter (DMT)-like permease